MLTVPWDLDNFMVKEYDAALAAILTDLSQANRFKHDRATVQDPTQ
jgi:hypothetical protein